MNAKTLFAIFVLASLCKNYLKPPELEYLTPINLSLFNTRAIAMTCYSQETQGVSILKAFAELDSVTLLKADPVPVPVPGLTPVSHTLLISM